MKLEVNNSIKELENYLADYPQVECKAKDYFAEGLYIRELTIPAGTIITGALHKKGHVNFITKGHFALTTKDASVEYHAPQMIISTPGVKKAVLAITETVWVTVHATELTDPDEILEDLTDLKRDELLGRTNCLQAKRQREIEQCHGDM